MARGADHDVGCVFVGGHGGGIAFLVDLKAGGELNLKALVNTEKEDLLEQVA